MALYRGIVLALVPAAVSAFRHKRTSEQPDEPQVVTYRAGVKVHNYRANVGEWMVLMRPGLSMASTESTCEGRCTLVGQGVPFVKFVGSEADLLEWASSHEGAIEFMEPDARDYPEEDAEVVEAQEGAPSWGLERIGVAEQTSTGSGVHIYVQDTGIRASHDDFEGRVVPTIDLTTDALLECKGDAKCTADLNGHGTHCAGTAAGKTYGVAPSATIHAVRTLGANGGQRSWQIAAIDWITTRGERPAVLSMSLSGAGQDNLYALTIDVAVQSGVTVVVAAGNQNINSCERCPAYIPSAITVGATTSLDARASYSNYGVCVNLFAPGSRINSASHASDTGVVALSGTSMATPHVAGAAALMLERDPTLKSPQIMALFAKTGKRDFVAERKEDDPNLFLYVGDSSAAQP